MELYVFGAVLGGKITAANTQINTTVLVHSLWRMGLKT